MVGWVFAVGAVKQEKIDVDGNRRTRPSGENGFIICRNDCFLWASIKRNRMNKINNITLNFMGTLIQHELFRVEIYRSGDIGDKNPAQS